MDVHNLKKGKILGKGVYGTVYLTEYNKTKYALKTQHILPSDRHKSYKSELWRELDFYDFISKMKPDDKKFFTQLHSYKIYDKCKHIQTREVIENKIFQKQLTALNKSKWCVDMVLDYQGDMTFGDYMSTHTISAKQTYSFILQIINICMILLKGGYRHTDLHIYNLMIKRTADKYFMFNRKKIPYYNYQLVSIDYGRVSHSKYLTGKVAKTQFNKEQDAYIYNYITQTLFTIIYNESKYTYQCKIQKKKQPELRRNFKSFDNLIYNIIIHHPKFWNSFVNNYKKSHKDIYELLLDIESHKNKRVDIVNNDKYSNAMFDVEYVLIDNFKVMFNRQFMKYQGWCSYHNPTLSRVNILNINKCNNMKQLLKFLYTKI